MKKLLAILLCGVLVFLCACSSTESSPNIAELLGKDKLEVEEALKITDVQPIDVGTPQEAYEVEMQIDGVSCTARYYFYNDVFSAYECSFSEVEGGFNYATTLREELENKFGEKITYEGYEGRYFDDVTEVSQLVENEIYYEMFDPKLDESIAFKMLDDSPYERIELRLQFISGEAGSVVMVAYSALWGAEGLGG